MSMGMYMIGVDPGMYNGSSGVGINGLYGFPGEDLDAVYDGRTEGGSVTDAGRDSRTLSGTGGKRRSVSFRTARTAGAYGRQLSY